MTTKLSPYVVGLRDFVEPCRHRGDDDKCEGYRIPLPAVARILLDF